jgi:hypothetical protein
MQVETPYCQYTVTYIATYDPSKSPEWTMTSWNGKTTEKPHKNVLKSRVNRYARLPVTIDENTLQATQDGYYLVVSFRINAITAPGEFLYYKDCDGKAHINTAREKLEKTVWDNFKRTKNQGVRVKKIHEEVFFEYAKSSYKVIKETQCMGAALQTKTGDVSGNANQTIVYRNYRKL